MNATSILDADMTTLAAWGRSITKWWWNELSSMVPARFQGRSVTLDHYLSFDANSGFAEHLDGTLSSIGLVRQNMPHLPVMFAPDACLVRGLKLPPVGEADMRKLVVLDADRIMPMPASALLLAVRTEARASPGGLAQIGVAGLPRATAESMMARAETAGHVPKRVGMIDPHRPELPPFDFTPAFKEAGLIGSAWSVASFWWMIVAFLFALNIAVFVWRDLQSVQNLQLLVDQQSPAVNAARAISKRMELAQNTAFQLAERRRRQDGVQILAEVSAVLPPQAWVQRFSWQGAEVRITGYKREGADVIGALRKSPLFDKVRASNAEVIAEIQSGQPFDISFVVRSST
jgi:hypothetical protein